MRDPDRAAVERFCRELAPLVTSGPPGIAGYAAGRPSPARRSDTGPPSSLVIWPKNNARRCSDRRGIGRHCVNRPKLERSGLDDGREPTMPQAARAFVWVTFAPRSGDKGGPVQHRSRRQRCRGLHLARARLTEAAVADFLGPLGIGAVKRYEVPVFVRSTSSSIKPWRGGEPLAPARHPRQGAGVVLLELKVPAPAVVTRPPQEVSDK